jgi:hypothetical protein
MSVPFIGLHFDLLHGLLETDPLFRRHRHKFDAELPLSAPPNYSVLNLNRRAMLDRRNPDSQRSAWLNVDETIDATTPDGEIHEGAFPANHASGGK